MRVQVSIGDATKTLASRIWENWIPFGSETEAEIAVVATARVPLSDVFSAGKHACQALLTRKFSHMSLETTCSAAV
jgi:hypothetical protein